MHNNRDAMCWEFKAIYYDEGSKEKRYKACRFPGDFTSP